VPAKSESYDYIIVGAGSAGCVLANRLSADPAVRVLLLEAGGDDAAPEVHIPAAFPAMLATERDWAYLSVEQERLDGRPVSLPRGRLLGGCSSMNAMVYVRGNQSDFNGWRDDHGAAGWDYLDVLPYFIRAEGNTRCRGPLHGTDGPQHVEDLVYRHELSQAWVESAVKWGLTPNEDFNGESQLGAGPFQVTCRDGLRWSAADAYLRPAQDRPNLTVRTHAQVSRLLLTGQRVDGVCYRSEAGADAGREVSVYARIEVLLCGGSINSPQLLLLSGIGPAEQLRALGIEVRVDLPGVGANLHDHPTVPLIWTTHSTDLADLASDPEVIAHYQTQRRGPLASNLCEAGAFFATDDSAITPDIQVHVAAVAFADGLAKPDRPCFTATASLLTPRSRGKVRLRSTDPAQAPEIDLNFYADHGDATAVVAGLRALAEIGSTGPLTSRLDRPFLPDRADLDDRTLAEHLARWTQTVYHPVGTCAMGTGQAAVVDPELRVHGVDRLRVVDASVMPTVTRGNTNAPTIMIAEKAADLILGCGTDLG
jgi:choline dehydrogenase